MQDSSSSFFVLLTPPHVFTIFIWGPQRASQKWKEAGPQRARTSKTNSNSCPLLHLLWSASFLPALLSALYHLLCAATNHTGVNHVFPLLHTPCFTWACTQSRLRAHNFTPQEETVALRFCTTNCSHSLTRDKWDSNFPEWNIVFPRGRSGRECFFLEYVPAVLPSLNLRRPLLPLAGFLCVCQCLHRGWAYIVYISDIPYNSR